MRAIIIAAGMGNRCQPHTIDSPKCLLQVGETTLIDNLLKIFMNLGIDEVGIVVGHCQDKIIDKLNDYPLDITYFYNTNYKNNNILHSLMYAEPFLADDVLISYSDIWLEQEPVQKLLSQKKDLIMAVDQDWMSAYQGRTLHPTSEAEKVLYDQNKLVHALGKHLPNQHDLYSVGEFIGLFSISKAFCSQFIQTFHDLNEKLSANSKFQHSVSWEKAYITDFFNELIDRDYSLSCSLHTGGWQEIDTTQDYEKLLAIKGVRDEYAV